MYGEADSTSTSFIFEYFVEYVCFNTSVGGADHCECDGGYLPGRKQRKYVNLTQDFTQRSGHQIIFLSSRPYKPLMCSANLWLRVRRGRGH